MDYIPDSCQKLHAGIIFAFMLRLVLFSCFRWFPAVLLLCHLAPGTVFAQEGGRISLDLQEKSLHGILEEISRQTGYKFAYSREEVDVDQVSSLRVRDAGIDEILRALSSAFGLEGELVGNNIILKPSSSGKEKTVEGQVFDARDNKPMQWVNISTTNGLHGTLTDSTGYFSIRLKPDQDELLFSFIGYHSRNLSIASDTLVRIYLKEAVRALDEIVVVAFGNEKKDLIGGAVSVVDPARFRQLNNTSVNASLQSAATGVLVNNNAGTPGSARTVIIRGISSITAGNRPLYVIDGIPMIHGNYAQLDFSGQTIDAVSDISINDIESISILKDAASSSLYGASASNGVILITTRKGTEEGNEIHLESYYGLQQTTGSLSMLNASQWMQLANEEAQAAGQDPVYTSGEIADNTTDTDWIEQVFQVAPTYSLHLSSRGGNERSGHYVSGNYFNQEGIVIGSSYDRYSFRINYSSMLGNKLSIDVGNGFTYSRNNRIEGDQSLNGPLPVAISMPPVYPVRNPDGSFNNDGPYANPVSIAEEETNVATTFRNQSHVSLNYQVAKGLEILSRNGLDFYNLSEHTFAPKTTRQGAKYNGLGIEATNNTFLLYHTTYLRYQRVFGEQEVSGMGGFSVERYRNHATFLRAQNFPGSSFEFLQDAATPIIASSSELDSRTNSFFASVNYNYANRYILNGNLRRDGSSKFGSNNRYGWFPSLSVVWYLSNESFWKNHTLFSRTRVRTSFGQTGNDQIEDFITLDLFAGGTNYHGEAGISPYQLSNPDLKWETTTELNIGLETELLGRIRLMADYYLRNTRDLLLENPIPTSTGYSHFLSNIGEIRNQGVEVGLSATIFRGSFLWDASFMLTCNQNRVMELYQDQPIRNIGRASSSIEEGYPVSYFYGFLSQGVDPATGLLIYSDVNDDGFITDQDRTYMGSPFPSAYGSLLNHLVFRGFELNILFSYSFGNDIYNSTRLYTETISLGNQTTAVLNRWKQEGDVTDVPRASSYNERISTRFLEDGSYLRLKSLKLSYSFPETLARKLGLSHFELYLAGQNLLTLTNYSGMDPEVNYNTYNPIVLGTDFFTCPQPQTLLLGLCAKF